ncbi:hypothetical protein KAS41_01245 [Candidatus Parcubacteria bacterium]|nr:hypothetical protein [Candidatus Parcubacteria bacterium]
MRNLIVVILFLAGFLILAGIFNWFDLGFKQIVGSGDIITKDIEISDFKNISLAGMGNLIIEQVGEESLKIEAEDNIMDVTYVSHLLQALYISVIKKHYGFLHG